MLSQGQEAREVQEAPKGRLSKSEVKDWLGYWERGGMVNIGAIRAFDQVYQARQYCSCMNVGVFSDITDGQIWDAIREMRAALSEASR